MGETGVLGACGLSDRPLAPAAASSRQHSAAMRRGQRPMRAENLVQRAANEPMVRDARSTGLLAGRPAPIVDAAAACGRVEAEAAALPVLDDADDDPDEADEPAAEPADEPDDRAGDFESDFASDFASVLESDFASDFDSDFFESLPSPEPDPFAARLSVR